MIVLSSYDEDDPKKSLLVVIADSVNVSKEGYLTEKDMVSIALAKALNEARESSDKEISELATKLHRELFNAVSYGGVMDYDSLINSVKEWLDNGV